MSTFDWVVGAIFLGSMLIGAWRGLVFEVLSVLGWVVAFFAAPWGAHDMATWLALEQPQSTLRYAIGFSVVFVMTVFAWGLLAWLIKQLIDSIGLRPADRALGALFGILRALVLVLVITAAVHWITWHEQSWWLQSQAAPVLTQLLQGLRPVLPEEFGRHLPL